MMKRCLTGLLSLCCAFAAPAVIAPVLAQSDDPSQNDPLEVTTLEVTHLEVTVVANAPPGGPGDKLWRMFDEAVTAQSDGRISLSLLVHGQIGGDARRIYDLVQEGKAAFSN